MQLSAFWNSAVQIMAAFTSLNSNFYILNLGRTLGFLLLPWRPCYFCAVNLGNHMVYRICLPLLSVSHCLRSVASCILSSVWVVKGGKVNPLSFTSSWPAVGVRIRFYPPMRHFYYVIWNDNYFLSAHYRYHFSVSLLLLKHQLSVFNIPLKVVCLFYLQLL